MEQSKLEKIKEAAYMAMVDFAKSDRAVPNASEIDAVLKRMDATGCKGLAKNMKLELWVIVRDCIMFTNREQLDKIEKALLGIIARYGREKEVRRKSFSLTKEQLSDEYVYQRQTARHQAKSDDEASMSDFDNTRIAWDSYDMMQAFEDGYTAHEQSIWRSADVELPEEGDVVLALDNDGGYVLAVRSGRNWKDVNRLNLRFIGHSWEKLLGDVAFPIVAWMPIPSLPETILMMR